MAAARTIHVGISACLVGQRVRYDGGHKLDRFLRDTLGRYVEFVPVCPEVECGLPVPREAMHLVGQPDHPRLVTVRTNVDHTARMEAWAARRVEELAALDLHGFIFKARSPSSGMERVKVYGGPAGPVKRGVGLWARAFMARFPLIPVEEDGRLSDPQLRENFIERLFVCRRWREALSAGGRGALVAFHTRHKLTLLAHSPRAYAALGRLVARIKDTPRPTFCQHYQDLLLPALRLRATRARHANVLQHVLGYFKRDLTRDEKQEMLQIIATYRAGHVPLIVPITLLNHYVRKYGQAYLAEQFYLNPHPIELGLRNHV